MSSKLQRKVAEKILDFSQRYKQNEERGGIYIFVINFFRRLKIKRSSHDGSVHTEPARSDMYFELRTSTLDRRPTTCLAVSPPRSSSITLKRVAWLVLPSVPAECQSQETCQRRQMRCVSAASYRTCSFQSSALACFPR